MKLKTLWVEEYGSLSHMAVPVYGQLSDGLNVLYGPNEAGKSQLKGFIEQLLFPKSAQRGARGIKPLGRVTFNHVGEEYILEVSRRGTSFHRQLYMEHGTIASDITDLFPSLTIGGNEVFSNLYSFGLDELLSSTTSGSGILSEHLFGAVAGGKGISINSVIDQLDEHIKRLTGREAKMRSLPKVLDDIEEANKQRLDKIADEEKFIEQFRKKDELVQQIHHLENESINASHELTVYKEVQRMADDYESFVASSNFLERFPQLNKLTPNLLRTVENLYSRAQGFQTSIEEFRKKLIDTSARLQSLQGDLAMSQQQEPVRAAENIMDELNRFRRELAVQSSRLEVNRANVTERASIIGVNIANWLDAGGSPDLYTAIEVLENAKGSLDLLQRQRSDYLDSPLVDAGREELLARRESIEESARKVHDLIEKSAFQKDVSQSKHWIWKGAAALVIAIMTAALYSAKFLTNLTDIVIFVLTCLLLVGVVSLLGYGRGSRLNRKGLADRSTVLASLGLDSLDSRQLMTKLEQYQQEKSVVDSILKFRQESERISGLVRNYGIAADDLISLETTMRQVSNLIHLLRDIFELRKSIGEVAEFRIRLNSRKQELVTSLRFDFPELVLSEEPSLDYLEVVISNLSDRFAASIEMRLKAEKLERDSNTFQSEITRLSDELRTVNTHIDEAIVPFGFSSETLDEDLLNVLRQFEQNQSRRVIFLRSVESVFGNQFERVLPYFRLGRIEVADMVSTFSDAVRNLREERDTLVKLQAEIEADERRLLRTNTVAESQSVIESLKLEAEELAGILRADVLARQLLGNANARFEELHQPELLRITSEIFARVTQGRYSSILKKEYGKGESIFVRNSSGEDILDALLSRGTREQLYISIRLALVTRPNSLDIPLLLDDVMVNADIDRAHGLASELVSVSQRRQVLYFCAKSDALRLFEAVGAKANVVEMERL